MILDVADGSSMQGWASIVLAGTRSVSVGHDAGKMHAGIAPKLQG
jgi:hypothetical protein